MQAEAKGKQMCFNNHLAKAKATEMEIQTLKNQDDDEEPELFNEEDPYDILYDKEMLWYIESLKEKFDLSDELDPREFIKKIDIELSEGKINEKQRFALKELKRGLQMELEQTPIEIDGDLDYESEESNDLTPDESQYMIYNQINDDAFNPQFESVFGTYENQDDFEYYNEVNKKNNKQPVSNGSRQAEIIDYMKPQYYFNSKNTTGIEQLRINDSDQDSKESTSKTPCFIGTPTGSSQIGSLNNTGALKAEDLINAIKKNDLERKFMHFSSGNSSCEKLQQPSFIPNMNSALSFGGNENNSDTREKDRPEVIVVNEYSNRKKSDEFDSFRT